MTIDAPRTGSWPDVLDRIAYLLLFLVCLTPLVFLPRTMFPFVIPKVVYFRVLVGGALVVLALRSFVDGGREARADPLHVVLGALLVVLVAASLVGHASIRSLLGRFERMWGVLTWAFMAAYYLALRAGVRSEEDWRRILEGWVWAATAVGAVGLAAQTGLLERGAWPFPDTGRLASTLGNSGPASAVLLLGMTTAGLVYTISTEARKRVVVGGCAAVQLAAFLLTGTRSAIGGVVLAALIIVAGYMVTRGSSGARKRSLAVILGLVLMVVAVGGLAQTRIADRVALLDRVAEFSPSARTLQGRAFVWEAAAETIGDRPLRGVGPENFEIAYDRRFDPRAYNVGLSSDRWDRAHNVFLGMGATAGIPALLFYLGFWLLLGWGVLKALRSGVLETGQALLLGGGLLAYFVYLNLWFEDHVSFAFLLTLAAYLFHRLSAEQVIEVFRFTPARWVGALGSAAAGVLLAVGTAHALEALDVSRSAYSAQFAIEDWSGLSHFEDAMSSRLPGTEMIAGLYLDRLRFLSRFGTEPVPGGTSTDALERSYAQLSEYLDRWERRSPLDRRVYLSRARLCRLRWQGSPSPETARCVIRNVEHAIQLSPTRIEQHHWLAAFHASNGDRQRARAVLNRALERYDGYGATYYHLAALAWDEGRRGEALTQLRAALDLNFGEVPVTFTLEVGTWLGEEGRPRGSADLYWRHLTVRNPWLTTDLRRQMVRRQPLGPWDLLLASRVPLLYLRAGRMDRAVHTARLLRIHLPDDAHRKDRARRVRRFVEDVRSGRIADWRDAKSVLRESDVPVRPKPAGRVGDETAVIRHDEPDRYEGVGAARIRNARVAGAAVGSAGSDDAGASRADRRARPDGQHRMVRLPAVSSEHRPAASRVGLSSEAGSGQDAGDYPARGGSHPAVVAGRADADGSGRHDRQSDAAHDGAVPGGFGPTATVHAALQQPRTGRARQSLSLPRTAGNPDRQQLLGTTADRAVQRPVTPGTYCTFFNEYAPVADNVPLHKRLNRYVSM